MGKEKNLYEAKRWLITAEDDLDTAILLRKNKKFAHSCFHAQQAGEKSLKALWFYLDEEPSGHSCKKLINDLRHIQKEIHNRLSGLEDDSLILDRFYIPARYPNGLPDITPDMAFNSSDCQQAIDVAQRIIDGVKVLIGID